MATVLIAGKAARGVAAAAAASDATQAYGEPALKRGHSVPVSAIPVPSLATRIQLSRLLQGLLVLFVLNASLLCCLLAFLIVVLLCSVLLFLLRAGDEEDGDEPMPQAAQSKRRQLAKPAAAAKRE